MECKNILIVDDDKEIRELLEIYLLNEGFKIFLAEDGIEALENLKTEKIHLIILDIMMPRLDGIKTCLKIREDNKLPIILLSAKSEDCDKILGLNIGADDYITKPFNPLEVVARAKSQLRRYIDFSDNVDKNNNEISIKGLSINKDTREVFLEGEFVRLTPIEFSILEILMENKGRVFSTKQIYEQVWNEPFYNSTNTVATHIRNLRDKIEVNTKNPQFIKVVWGVGYKIDE